MKNFNTCYQIDCLAYMMECPDNMFDLAIVDPPYGNNDAIFLKNCRGHKANRPDYKKWNNTAPDKKYFKELFRISNNQIICGGNWYGLKGGYICWNKNGSFFGECELLYCSLQNKVTIFEYTWNGMIQKNMKNKEKRIHPTQKPVDLYKWLLQNYAKPGWTIFDSHVGSGSIRIACHDLGFDFIGIELDLDYFNAQEERFKNHIQQPEIFTKKELQKNIFIDNTLDL